MGRQIKHWLRILDAGARPLDTIARLIAVAVLLLGIAGITVTLVLHLPWPLTMVIIVVLLLLVILEGSYRIWYATGQERLSAETARDAAQREMRAQPGPSPRSGLEIVITNEVPTPFPGLALILEIEYTVTNHDAMEHMLFMGLRGQLFFPPTDKQGDPEYLSSPDVRGDFRSPQTRSTASGPTG